ncbi:MaoC/PaaZ C-terminal domain-containing protein [Bacillus tianshenii]|nr:MaoC/PaaZ C-terminal domain-containing protein [Bacillus tianshenii]
MLMKRRKTQGRKIDEISTGERLVITEKIEDKDLLLYLGLTDDANPLYIQHDYASRTPQKQPIVPPIMLTGIITSAVTKYLPGPGSMIKAQQFSFPHPAYHYENINYEFEVREVLTDEHIVIIGVSATSESGEVVVEGTIDVCPPYPFEPITGRMLDNF